MRLSAETINSLGNFIDKLENSIKTGVMDISALEKGAERMEKTLKDSAPVRTGEAKTHIHHFIKINGKTLKVLKVGFEDKGWEKWKGLYFNHYGFNNQRTGTYVDKHLGWFDRAYKSGENEVIEIVKRGISEKINGIL